MSTLSNEIYSIGPCHLLTLSIVHIRQRYMSTQHQMIYHSQMEQCPNPYLKQLVKQYKMSVVSLCLRMEDYNLEILQ